MGNKCYKKKVREEKKVEGHNFQRNQDVFSVLNLMRFMQTINNDQKLFPATTTKEEKERLLGACIAGFASLLEEPKSDCEKLCDRLKDTSPGAARNK